MPFRVKLLARALFVVAAGPMALYLLAVWHSGDIRSFLANMRGESLIANTTELDLGIVHPRQASVAAITLRNVASRPITVLGCNQTCEFTLAEHLPTDLLAGESRLFHLRVVPAAHRTRFAYAFRFHVYGDVSPVKIKLTGSMLGHSSPEPPLVEDD